MSVRKHPTERSNREHPVYEDLNIIWDGKTRGPTLPRGYTWCTRTKEWWQTLRNSAQAMAFHATDWEFLFETALIHNRLWGSTDRLSPNSMSTLAGELRIRLERYGFSWADRRKFGIHISTPEQAAEEAEQITRQSAAVDYRRKLNGLD